MPQARLENEGHIYREQRTNRALATGAVLTALALLAAGLYSIPQEPAKPITPELPTPRPSEPRVTFNGRTAPEVLISQLEAPNSTILMEWQDRFDRDGLKISELYDCSRDKSSMDRAFSKPATLRLAPFRISKAIREIAAGEQFESAIEVAVNHVTGKTPTERWMGKIEGTSILWAAKEEAYRQYAVNVWPQEATCTPFSLGFDYTKGPDTVAK